MDQAVRKDWHGTAELAAACGCTADEVEALARRHHWPRVHGEHGQKIGADPETVRQALQGSARSVHGSVPPR